MEEIQSMKEIKNVVFQIEFHKSPGAMDTPARFYQRMWDVLGQDITNLVKTFFEN